jgi:WD40 repeat protein
VLNYRVRIVDVFYGRTVTEQGVYRVLQKSDREEYSRTKGVKEDMSRKFKYLSLTLGLILLALTAGGCLHITAVPKASMVSGRVVLVDSASGLAGVSLLIVDGTSSYLETDAEGYFETAAFSNTVIIPRKTGYSFFPERQAVGEGQELEFVAYPWAEPDFSNWGVQFSFDSHLDWVEAIAFSADDRFVASGSSDRTIRIWRTDDGQLVRTLSGHTDAVKAIAFSPQGHYLA